MSNVCLSKTIVQDLAIHCCDVGSATSSGNTLAHEPMEIEREGYLDVDSVQNLATRSADELYIELRHLEGERLAPSANLKITSVLAWSHIPLVKAR